MNRRDLKLEGEYTGDRGESLSEHKEMTLERLNQYRCLKHEVEILKQSILDMEYRARHPRIVSDTVTGSSSDFPYVQHSVLIRGADELEREYCRERVARLESKVTKLLDETTAIETYIDHVEDSQIRQILHLRFFRGLTWRQTAKQCGGGNTEDSVRKRLERYFQ